MIPVAVVTDDDDDDFVFFSGGRLLSLSDPELVAEPDPLASEEVVVVVELGSGSPTAFLFL